MRSCISAWVICCVVVTALICCLLKYSSRDGNAPRVQSFGLVVETATSTVYRAITERLVDISCFTINRESKGFLGQCQDRHGT